MSFKFRFGNGLLTSKFVPTPSAMAEDEADVSATEDKDTKLSSGPKKVESSTSKMILMILLGVALVAVGSFIAIMVVNLAVEAKQRAVCEEIESFEETGKSAGIENKEPSVNDMVLCHSLKCSFDVLQCKAPCPFGFEMDEDDCAKSCTCAAAGLFQGDIQFDSSDVPVFLESFGHTSENDDFSLVSRAVPLWNQKIGNRTIIPYSLADLTSEQTKSWKKAIASLERRTCLQFVTKTEDEMDYLLVVKTAHPDCSSFIGRKGGEQRLNMGTCFSVNHVDHMIMHALGFHHEHTRSDRDAYIKIQLENVMEEFKPMFGKEVENKMSPYKTDFDRNGVTMFTGFAFSIDEKQKPTILDIDTDQAVVVQNTEDFSLNDIIDINSVYCRSDEPVASVPDTATGKSAAGRSSMLFSMDTFASFLDFGFEPETEKQWKWTDWGSWTYCDKKCGNARKRRYRTCLCEAGGKFLVEVGKCRGSGVTSFPCVNIPCYNRDERVPTWGQWGEYNPCGITCGTSTIYRSRVCMRNNYQPECKGNRLQGKTCFKGPCPRPLQAAFDPWTQWGECSVTCGGGFKTRYRVCYEYWRRRSRRCEGLVDWDENNDGIEYESLKCGSDRCPGGRKPQLWFSNSAVSKSLEKPGWFRRARNPIPKEICDPGPKSIWLFGDFNADGREDILCGDHSGEVKIVLAENGNKLVEVSWKGKLEKCMVEFLYTGDFNADKTTDLLCVATDGAETDLLIFPGEDGKLKDPVTAGNLCVGIKWSLYVVDANGDGKDDILCRDLSKATDAYSEIHLNVLE